MCKPGKSFNTGIKSYSLRHMKMPCKSSRAGGAPPRTDALIGPAAFGDVQKNGLFKTTRERRALSLLFWRSDSLEHGLNISETPRSCALQRAPVRWTLTLKTNHLWSLRPCQSRKIAEQRIQRLQSRELSRWRHAAEVSPKEKPETKNWTHTGKRNQKATACFNNRQQV